MIYGVSERMDGHGEMVNDSPIEPKRRSQFEGQPVVGEKIGHRRYYTAFQGRLERLKAIVKRKRATA